MGRRIADRVARRKPLENVVKVVPYLLPVVGAKSRSYSSYRQPVLRASQALAISLCDAWNGRSVGNPGGGSPPTSAAELRYMRGLIGR
jgi:hypothetical protein